MSAVQEKNIGDWDRDGSLREKHHLDSQRFSRALNGFVEAATGHRLTAQIDETDPLASAIARAASAYHLSPRKALPPPDLQPLDQRMTELAEQQQMRCRKIKLDAQWYRQANFCLIVPTGDDYATLVPRNETGFDLYSSTDSGRPVDAELAQQLGAEAYVIYPPLPADVGSTAAFIKLALWRHTRSFYLIPLLLLCGSLLGLLPPVVTKYLVGTVIPFNETSQLPAIAIAMIVAAIGIALLKLLASLSVIRLETAFDSRGQAAVWSHLLRLPVSFFRRVPTGELSVKVQSVDAIRSMLSSALVNSAASVAMAFASLGLMLHYQHKLAIPVILLAGIYALGNSVIGRQIAAHTSDTIASESALRAMTFQLLGGISKLRAAAAERSAFALWTPTYLRFSRQTRSVARWRAYGIVLQSMMPALLLLLLVFMIAQESKLLLAVFKTPTSWQELDVTPLREVMPPALFLAFFMAATQFLTAVKSISDAYLQLVGVRPHFAAVNEFMAQAPELQDEGAAPGELNGKLEIADVDFRYAPDTPLALQGASLTAQPGEFIAIVGPSGAGKSSLIRLILGFDEAERGAIFFDDKDFAGLNRRLVRRQFGVVLQDSQLLPGSLFDNIAAGTGITPEEAWEAARLAGMDDDIRKMPMQMHTVLSEGATTLSGGQRQRLIIARALARRPAYILFDEATSALDNRTQAIVSSSLEQIGCTRIVIAHRLSTIINADRIYVMDQGAVVEKGTYEELMAQGGVFFQLASKQIS